MLQLHLSITNLLQLQLLQKWNEITIPLLNKKSTSNKSLRYFAKLVITQYN